jgi:hypothetical protein
MFIIKTKCAVCEKLHDARNKNCRIRQQKMKKTRSTKIDDISFFSVKQTSIKLVVAVMLRSSFFEVHFFFSSVKRKEFLASQNDFQKDSQNRTSSFESASSESSKSDLCSFAVVFDVAFVAVFALDDLFVVTHVDVFKQYFMILFMTSSTHLNWQTIWRKWKNKVDK